MSLLIEEVSSLKQLNLAWKHVRQNKHASPGIDDEESVDAFSYVYKQNLKLISTELKEGTYKFSPALLKKIPKNNNKYREINIFTIRDKIVQKSLQISLERKRKGKILFPDTRNKISIGFLHKVDNKDEIGIKKAIKEIKLNYQKGYLVLTVCDIKDFFKNIDKKKLTSIVSKNLPDRSLDLIIKDCISTEVLERDRFDYDNLLSITSSGVSQGSILSPLFSNIYLMAFDKKIEKKGIVALRYADDLAFFSKTQREAEGNLELIKKILKSVAKLEFHSEDDKKPKHYAIKTRCFYLGLHIEIKMDNWEISPDTDKIKKMKNKIREKLSPSSKETLFERIGYLNRSVKSWYKTYEYLGCNKRLLHKIYQELHNCYIEKLEHLLIEKGILKGHLSKSNIAFLDIMSRKNNKRYS